MEIIKQICEMCRYKNQSNATFPCVDCCSRDRWELAESIVVSSKAIQAQQQEINLLIMEITELRESNQALKDYAENADADKDEQAGRIMELDSGLERLRLSLQWLYEINTNRWYKEWAKEKIAEIDALLGGGEE